MFYFSAADQRIKLIYIARLFHVLIIRNRSRESMAKTWLVLSRRIYSYLIVSYRESFASSRS